VTMIEPDYEIMKPMYLSLATTIKHSAISRGILNVISSHHAIRLAVARRLKWGTKAVFDAGHPAS
jgi:hypothetical protein